VEISRNFPTVWLASRHVGHDPRKSRLARYPEGWAAVKIREQPRWRHSTGVNRSGQRRGSQCPWAPDQDEGQDTEGTFSRRAEWHKTGLRRCFWGEGEWTELLDKWIRMVALMVRKIYLKSGTISAHFLEGNEAKKAKSTRNLPGPSSMLHCRAL
jgi:hypothetical protein